MDKEQVPKEEVQKLFGNGAILTDHWYELQIKMKAFNPSEDIVEDDYIEMCFPAGYAFATKSDWFKACDWLDDSLNRAITDGFGDNFNVILRTKAFSGMGYHKGSDEPTQMPFVISKKHIDEDFEEVINQMWEFIPELCYEKLKELSEKVMDGDGDCVSWNKNYKPNTFEI